MDVKEFHSAQVCGHPGGELQLIIKISNSQHDPRKQWTTLGVMNSLPINVFKERLGLQLEAELGIR